MNTSSSTPRALPGRARLLRRIAEFARYFVASAGALAVDAGLYRLGLQAGLAYQWAALIGFCAGAVVAYVASIAWVFEARTIRRSTLEFGLFVAIGVAGLLLTELLLWVQIEHFGWPKFQSKAGAAGVVFFFNFGMRKTLLFGGRLAQLKSVSAVDAVARSS
jgi:putative flippase GtrA